MEHRQEFFPDGTLIADWFYNTEVPTLEQLGKQFRLDEYGISQDGQVHTAEIQRVIDLCAAEGGVVVVPKGVWMSGSLYFRQGTNLYIEEGGVLMGSDDIADYDLKTTRIEGQTCTYFTALINVENVQGFTMCGPGTVDGNGFRSWRAFWIRRRWNPKCTNKDEQRPRLVYVSNSTDVTIAGLTLQNAHFWTTHLYRCQRVKYLGCRITSPSLPVKAPSTDAIDIDVCTDVLVKNCYMSVNDDSVVLKGGKGPWADTDPNNGSNERILVEDCIYGFCHGVLTCGSESVHDRNILVRRCRLECDSTTGIISNMLVLKMRPDTPQKYEYITLEDITGRTTRFLNINPWVQFYDLGDRKDIPLSYGEHITFRNCDVDCTIFLHVAPKEDQYRLTDFRFEGLNIRTKDPGADTALFPDWTFQDVNVAVVGGE